jgi:hypothetical protein
MDTTGGRMGEVVSGDKQTYTRSPISGRPVRWGRWLALGVLLAALGGGAYAWRQVAPYGEIGSVYIAKQYCSCLFVTGRPETSCKAEYKPDIDKFTLSVDRSRMPATARVSARMAVFEGVATYDSRFGCTVGK